VELFGKVRGCMFVPFSFRDVDERIDSELTHVFQLVANCHSSSVHFLIVHTENASEER
jgi:hypothetical protein